MMAQVLCPTCGRPLGDHRDPVALGAGIRLSPLERRLFDKLARTFAAWVPADALVDAAYGSEIDGGPDDARRAIASVLKTLRRKLRPYDLEVEAVPGRGDGLRRLVWVAR